MRQGYAFIPSYASQVMRGQIHRTITGQTVIEGELRTLPHIRVFAIRCWRVLCGCRDSAASQRRLVARGTADDAGRAGRQPRSVLAEAGQDQRGSAGDHLAEKSTSNVLNPTLKRMPTTEAPQTRSCQRLISDRARLPEVDSYAGYPSASIAAAAAKSFSVSLLPASCVVNATSTRRQPMLKSGW